MDLNKLKLLLDYIEIDYAKHILPHLGVTLKKNVEDHVVVNKLYSEIIQNNGLENLIYLLDKNCIEIIESVAELGLIQVKQKDRLLLYYETLSEYGFLLKLTENDRVFYTIASEVYEIISKNKLVIQKEFNTNKIILKFAKAAVAYYGLLDKDEITELYNHYHRYSKVDIFPRLEFYSKLQAVFTFNGEYLYDNNVRDTDGFIKDKSHFKSLSLYKYTLDQFYVDEHYINLDIDVDFYFELVNYFTEEIKCDSSIIVAIYYFLMYEYDIDYLKEVIAKETIVDINKFDKRFDQYIKNLYPFVRCWVLKGHMISEVNQMIMEDPTLYLESDFVLLKKGQKQHKHRRLFG